MGVNWSIGGTNWSTNPQGCSSTKMVLINEYYTGKPIYYDNLTREQCDRVDRYGFNLLYKNPIFFDPDKKECEFDFITANDYCRCDAECLGIKEHNGLYALIRNGTNIVSTEKDSIYLFKDVENITVSPNPTNPTNPTNPIGQQNLAPVVVPVQLRAIDEDTPLEFYRYQLTEGSKDPEGSYIYPANLKTEDGEIQNIE